ncbi:MAG: glycogen synthase GlgA [Thermodesulfobacteriota bacterium]|nr:MAG: glycogen synthase GlgA [Thermodesulfobacteriota bacterium]
MGLKVVFVASEATPLAKTGGLGDVAGALPAALKALGCEVFTFLPYYREVDLRGIETEPTGVTVEIPIGVRVVSAELYRALSTEVTTYLLKRDEFYDRTYIYGTPEGGYFDNLERYGFFSRGVLEAIKALKIRPDIIHSNDWQTGLVPAYLKDVYKKDKTFVRTASVFTIHNTAYQGTFQAELYGLLGLAPGLFTHDGLEFWGKINLLKAGVAFSDIITTVSPGYSVEIQTPEFGCGLEGLLKKRSAELFGVLNGADYKEWDPGSDPLIPANFSVDDMSGKTVCRRELLKTFGLKPGISTPVIGMISRLAEQKGYDILAEALPALMKLDLALVILGSGEKKYEELLKTLAAKYPKKLAVKVAFDNRLAHLVEAGSDVFLMPSKYEPCGLNQIYSLRYGTVPVVRATGGLDDTVRGYPSARATGFKFKDYSAPALVEKVKEALDLYRDKKKWKALREKAMTEDFSWERSARKYIGLYRGALKKARREKKPLPKGVKRR